MGLIKIMFQIYDYAGEKVFEPFHSRISAKYMIDNYLSKNHFIIEIEVEQKLQRNV